MEDRQGPEGVVMEVKKGDVVKILALPEISAHDESTQPFKIDHMKAPIEDFKRGYWKSSLLVFGVILMAIPLSVARAEQKSWQDVRDDFLEGDPELLQLHCDRGEEANQEARSAFNDEWVKTVQTMRFEAGVATRRPNSSNLFFSGLSMAMKSRCPGVW